MKINFVNHRDASTSVKAEPAASSSKAVKAAHCWNASDDLLLKDSLQVFCYTLALPNVCWTSNQQVIHDFERIAKSIKFSVKVTAKDLEYRWRQMLYDPKVAQYANRLHPCASARVWCADVIHREAAEGMSSVSAQTKRMLWGDEEENVLRREVAAPGFTNYQSVCARSHSSFPRYSLIDVCACALAGAWEQPRSVSLIAHPQEPRGTFLPHETRGHHHSRPCARRGSSPRWDLRRCCWCWYAQTHFAF